MHSVKNRFPTKPLMRKYSATKPTVGKASATKPIRRKASATKPVLEQFQLKNDMKA